MLGLAKLGRRQLTIPPPISPRQPAPAASAPPKAVQFNADGDIIPSARLVKLFGTGDSRELAQMVDKHSAKPVEAKWNKFAIPETETTEDDEGEADEIVDAVEEIYTVSKLISIIRGR